MGRILRFELGKILTRKLSWVCLGFLFLMGLLLWDGNGRGYIVTPEGTELSGREAAAYSRERAALYEGELTPEKVIACMTAEGPKITEENQEYAQYEKLPLMEALHYLFHEAEQKATGVGEWESATSEQIRENLEVYEQEVEKAWEELEEDGYSLRLGAAEGWELLLYVASMLMLFAGAVCVVLLAGMFSEEYSRGTDALILTARYGRKKTAAAKLLAGCLVSAGILAVLLLPICLYMLILYGVQGWDVSLQVSVTGAYTGARPEINYLQAFFLEVFLWMASLLTTGALTMLISSRCRSAFLSLVISLTLYLAPAVFSSVLPKAVTAATPIGMITTMPLELSGLPLGGSFLPGWSVCVLSLAAALAAVWLLGRRWFSRHQVQQA